MRTLLILFSITIALLTTYWHGTKILISYFPQTIEKIKKPDGMNLSIESIQTSGFPITFNILLKKPKAINKNKNFAWATDEIALNTVAYYPFTWSLSSSESHTFSLRNSILNINLKDPHAEVGFEPATKLNLDFINLHFNNIVVNYNDIFSYAIDSFNTNFTQISDSLYEIQGSAEKVSLIDYPILNIFEGHEEYLNITSFSIDGNILLNASLDRSALSKSFPNLEKVNIHEAQLTWGNTLFKTSAIFETDKAGYLNGEIVFEIYNWNSIIEMAKENNIIDPDIISFIVPFLDQLSRLSEDKNSITVPLQISEGSIKYGMLELYKIESTK